MNDQTEVNDKSRAYGQSLSNAGLGNGLLEEEDMSIVVYGPQGCGKTRNGAAIAAHFGVLHIIDDWKPGDPLPENTLALTNVPGVAGAIEFSDVAGLLTVP